MESAILPMMAQKVGLELGVGTHHRVPLARLHPDPPGQRMAQQATLPHAAPAIGQDVIMIAEGPSTLIGFPAVPVAVAIGVTAPDPEAT